MLSKKTATILLKRFFWARGLLAVLVLACFLALIFTSFIGVEQVLAESSPQPTDTVNEDTWITNGTVNAIVTDATTTYIGGEFTYVGPNIGYGAPISTETGAVSGTYPKVNGSIEVSISDGSGGWYIGGSFTKVGSETRNRIAHILSDGTVDSNFDPNANNTVYTLALDTSNSLIYAGGTFTTIGGETRNRIAALSTSTGTASAWNPNASSTVNALALDTSNSLIYTGGGFTTIGGQTRNRIAALSTSTGTASAWDPNASSTVNTLALDTSNSLIYAGGYFTTIGGESRNYIAALSTSTGTASAWNPNASSTVLALALDTSNSLIYAGGSFTTIGGQTRNKIAALSTSTGTATSWNPNASFTVWGLALDTSNSLIYAGGGFTTIGGESRNYIAALSTSTGAASAWNPNASSTVNTLALDTSNSLIYAGGDFTTIGGQTRNRIAALSTSTGAATAWNPNASFTVRTLALDTSNSLIYAGGDFTTIGGEARNKIAALSTSTGTASAWNPNASSTVYALALDTSNSLIYAGGAFTTIGGETRNYIAALSTSTGAATAWNPNANSSILTLSLDTSNSLIYAGGYFTTIGGETRNRIAALSTSTGAATAWNPNASSLPWTLALDTSNSLIYAGGDFTTIGGEYRNRIAALSTSTGAASAWNPNANSTVYALALDTSNSLIYAGGYFTTIGGESRNKIAALSTSTGTASAWNPNASASVYTLTLDTSNSLIYAGGSFVSIGGEVQLYLVEFLFDTFPPVRSNISPADGSTIADSTQTITFDTDENATCYLSLDGDEAYADMSDDTLCLGEGTTSQSCTTPDLGADGAKNVYIACQDSNSNADDETTNEDLVYTLDTTAPTITSVSSDKDNGTYGVGEVIDIDVTFSENVTSTGDITVTLETGDTDRTCTFSVTNSSTGTCDYTIQNGDASGDLNVLSISGTINDQVNNTMVNFTPATNLSDSKNIIILTDQTPPNTGFGIIRDVNDITITLTCLDESSECQVTYYCHDTENTCVPTTTYTIPVSFSISQTTYFKYYSVDTRANTESVSTTTLSLFGGSGGGESVFSPPPPEPAPEPEPEPEIEPIVPLYPIEEIIEAPKYIVEQIQKITQELAKTPEQITENIQNISREVVEVTKQIAKLITPPFGESGLQGLGPIAEAVPQEAPPVFKGWDIMEVMPVSELALNPVENDIAFFADRIPQFKETLLAFGIDITSAIDAQKISGVDLYLPGLAKVALTETEISEISEFGGSSKLPLAQFTTQALAKIPTDIVFIRTGGELIDYSLAISVDKQGQVRQRVETISGKPLKLVIKPGIEASSVVGFMTFKEAWVGMEKANLFESIGRLFTDSILDDSAREIAFSGQNGDNKGQGLLLVDKFEYIETRPGIFTANITAPITEGEYEVSTVIVPEDILIAPKETKMAVVVNPEGYVFAQLPDGHLRIKGAEVVLYWLNPETKQYEVWPAERFLQKNPILTDETGKYSFLVPEGTYKLKAEVLNYKTYESEPFEMKQDIAVNKNIEVFKKAGFFGWLTWQNMVLFLLCLVVALLMVAIIIIVYKKGRINN